MTLNRQTPPFASPLSDQKTRNVVVAKTKDLSSSDAHIKRPSQKISFARENLFAIFLAIENDIKKVLTKQGYKGITPVGSGYTLDACRRFIICLEHIFQCSLLSKMDSFMLKDAAGFNVCLDATAIRHEIWSSMSRNGAFAHAPRLYKQLFEFVYPPTTRDPHAPEGWRKGDWLGVPKKSADRILMHNTFFCRPQDIIDCMNAFDLGKEWLQKLLHGFFQAKLSEQGTQFFEMFCNEMILAWIAVDRRDLIALLINTDFYLKTGNTYFWNVTMEPLWAYVIKNGDTDLMEDVAKRSFASIYSWKQLKQVKPQELYSIILGQSKKLFNWTTQNLSFSKEIASYILAGGGTLLHTAANLNHVAAVQLLIALGVDVNHKNEQGFVADYYTTNAEIQQLLANRRIELGLRAKLTMGELVASDDVKSVIQYYPAKSNVDDTLLMVAAKYGRTNSVTLLLDSVPVDLLNFSNKSALDFAIEARSIEIVKVLANKLIHGCLPGDNMLGIYLDRAMLFAVKINQVEIFNLLPVLFHKEVNDLFFSCQFSFISCLKYAVENNSFVMVKAIFEFALQYNKLERLLSRIPGSDYDHLLSVAAEKGNLGMIKILIEQGKFVDYYPGGCHARDQYITPALVAAAKANQKEVFIMLMKYAVYIPQRMEKFRSEEDSSKDEVFPGEYNELIQQECVRRERIFSCIKSGGSDSDVLSLPLGCVDSNKQGLLMHAVKFKRLDLVKLLLSRGEDANGTAGGLDDADQYPLKLALINGEYLIAAELLVYGADSDYVKMGRDETVVDFILKNYPGDALVYFQDIGKRNPKCWSSLFESQLFEISYERWEKMSAQIITLASRDDRIAQEIFERFLDDEDDDEDDENPFAMVLQTLTETLEGRAILQRFAVTDKSVVPAESPQKLSGSKEEQPLDRKIEYRFPVMQPTASISTLFVAKEKAPGSSRDKGQEKRKRDSDFSAHGKKGKSEVESSSSALSKR